MRLFVALVPPADVLAALPALPASVRPVPPGRQHVTLAFLGEVAGAAAVAAALDAALPGSPAPVLRLAGAGAFRRAVWLGLAGDLPGLHHLAGGVQDAVRAAGVDLERRRWHPHLTVGRGPLPPHLLPYEGPAVAWDRVELVRSHLGGPGARHEALRSWPLS